MKKSRIIALLISAIMVLTLTAGCQSKASQGTEQGTAAADNTPVSIDFWGGWNGPDAAAMQKIVDSYNSSQSKIHVNLTMQQWTPLYTKFLTEVKAGNPPDIMTTHPFELGQFASMDILNSETVKSIQLSKSDYEASIWDATFYKGTQYAVPLDMHTHGLFYNKDLFKKAGLTNPPKTGAELIEMGQKLTVDKNGKHPNEAGFDDQNIVQYGLGMAMTHHIFYQWYALMNQQGEDPFSADMKKVSFSDDKAVKAFTFLQDLVFKYKIAPKGEKSPGDDFLAGTVAMEIDGPWQFPKYETAKLNFGLGEYPQVFEKKAVWGAAHIFIFPANKNQDAKKKAASVEFVKWLTNNTKQWADDGYIPSKKSTLDYVKTLPNRTAFIDTVQYGKNLPANPLSTQIFSAAAPSPILTAVQDLMLNGKKPADVVTQMKKDMDAILAGQ